MLEANPVGLVFANAKKSSFNEEACQLYTIDVVIFKLQCKLSVGGKIAEKEDYISLSSPSLKSY